MDHITLLLALFGIDDLLVAALVTALVGAGTAAVQSQQQNKRIKRQQENVQAAERVNQAQLRGVRDAEREAVIAETARERAALTTLSAASGTLGGESVAALLRQSVIDGQTDLASVDANAGRRSFASSSRARAGIDELGLGLANTGQVVAGAVQTGVAAGSQVYSIGSSIRGAQQAADTAEQSAALARMNAARATTRGRSPGTAEMSPGANSAANPLR